MPPLAITCMWPSCSSRNGANAKATPATAAPAGPIDLSRQQIRAEEGQGVGEDEEDVVADDRLFRTVADHPCGGVADQRIAEGERVWDRPEAVRVEEFERLIEERVAAPGGLPGDRQRVADVAGDHIPEIEDERPGHRRRPPQPRLRRAAPLWWSGETHPRAPAQSLQATLGRASSQFTMPGAPYVHMLRAMTTVLIVVGVILFLLLDAYVIARVFRSRASADDYASIAVPGETTVTVPAGKLKLTYQESYNAPSTGDGDIEFGTPSALQVTVTSAAGEALEVKGPGFRGMGSSSPLGAARAAR